MLINETIQHFGSIDILVNNAGSSLSKGIEDLDDEQWYSDIELKVMVAVRMCKGVIPYMKTQRSGCIVDATKVLVRSQYLRDCQPVFQELQGLI